MPVTVDRPLNEPRTLSVTPPWGPVRPTGAPREGWGRILCLAAIGSGLFLLLFVPITKVAQGPAVIEYGDRTDVRTEMVGTVADVAVSAGDVVRAGQPLVKLSDHMPLMELSKIDAELQRDLWSALRTRIPLEGVSLAGLYAERTRLVNHMAHLTVAAPHDGRVLVARVRAGQAVEAGDVLVTLTGTGGHSYTVLGVLPGPTARYVRPGDLGSVRIAGEADVTVAFHITSVIEHVRSSTALSKYFPSELADVVPDDIPSIVVRGSVTDSGTLGGEASTAMNDGMRGRMSVAAGERTLIGLLRERVSRPRQ